MSRIAPPPGSRRGRRGGRGRLALELALLVAVVLAILGAARLVVGIAGREGAARRDRGPGALMRWAETRLGELAYRTLEPQLVDEPGITEPVLALGERVFATLDADPPTLLVLDSNTVNAFALPGGMVVVCLGLLRSLESAEELAAVIAHEAAHVVNRDVARAMTRQVAVSALLSILGGSQSQVLLDQILGELINNGFSRDVEAAADTMALVLLADAQIDPGALADAFGRLAREGEGAPAGVLRYLESHPELEQRIATARQASDAATARRGAPWVPFDPAIWSALSSAL